MKKLEPPKREEKAKPHTYMKEFKYALRVLFALTGAVLGFMLSKSQIFSHLPTFGYHTILEVLISLGMAWVGFYLLPLVLVKIKFWIETTIANIVSDIVTNFWNQQSKHIQDARREKQKSKAEEEKKKKEDDMKNAVVIDTSVLIDGRLLDIVNAGFCDKTLIVPNPVIDELQLVADNKNAIKRQRGRRGLDIVKNLKKKSKVLLVDVNTGEKEVDKKLVKYAKEHKLPLMTLDFNLNKVAKLSGVFVMNLNDLVNALKTVYLPGEEFLIKIIQEGKEKKQGIGYLSDGTMVIVEDAKDKVGTEINVKVAKIIQSSAGKIIFCNFVEPAKAIEEVKK